jgi:very-short-patch-repair endonuclease
LVDTLLIFICRERRLIVEVDGGQHNAGRDRERDEWLRTRKYRVLHFWNNDVMTNIEGVLEVIAAALDAETPPHPDRASARSDLSPQAGRGNRVARPTK